MQRCSGTGESAGGGGLYFLGFLGLASRKSGIIYGIEEDAAF